MGEPDMTPLAEASLEDLMAEFERRYDHFIFAWSNLKTRDEYARGSWKRGDATACIGLCRLLERRLIALFDEEDEESPDA